MRLVCPNCGAQYEVDDRVIPDNGRDVQCSSCGHAWYQMPSNLVTGEEPAPDEPEEVLGVDDDESDLEPETAPRPDAGPEPAAGDGDGDGSAHDQPAGETAHEAEAGSAESLASDAPDTSEPADMSETAATDTAPERVPDGDPDGDADSADSDDEDAPLPEASAALPRRELDQNLRSILQEEVAREMAARSGETGTDAIDPAAATPSESDQTSPDPGQEVSEAADKDGFPDIGPAPVNEHQSDGLAVAPTALVTTDKSPRKDLFPDIEEINSTLDSHGPAEDLEEEAEPEGSGGFGRAFLAVVAIAALALVIYLLAPNLARSIPALEPALTAYVEAVNGARSWLDSTLQGLTNRIDSAR